MKRILVVLAISAAAIAVGAAGAKAELLTNTTVSYAYSGWVPCANDGLGELLTGTIDAHILEASTANASHFSFDAHGTLVGQATGDSYRLAALTRGSSMDLVDHGTLTYVSRYRLIGPGPGNNLIVRETAHITRDGDADVVDKDWFDIECG
jgi:subtilisin family serine protease